MDRNFQRALPLVLKYEGGFADHPKDPGGATNKGVTLATFRRYVKADATVADLKRITDEQVATVYYRHYWAVVNAQALPAGVDFATFDFAVNSGPARAARYLQAVVGVRQDGKVGPATIAACRAMDAREIVNRLCDARMAFLRGLKIWSTFGKGWASRVTSVRANALAMVGNPADVVTETVKVPVEVEKPVVPEEVEKAVKKQTNGWGWSGVGLGGAGAALTAIAGWPWQTIAIFAGIGIAGGLVALVIGPWIVKRVKAIRAEVAA